MPVLIVEGEHHIAEPLRSELQGRGLMVMVAATLEAASDLVGRRTFSIVVVDLVLPDGCGIELLDRLHRLRSGAHVIVLSSSTAPADRARALAAGAGDYVVRPFSVRDLSARVLAGYRRSGTDDDGLVQVGPLEIDLDGRQVTVAGRLLDLATKEFDLLAFLATRSGHVFTRDQLLRAVWQSASEWQGPATVTEHIRRLRIKIERDPGQPRILRTVRGVGYRLDRPPEESGEAPGTADAAAGPGTIIHVGDRVVFADGAAGALLGYAHADDLVGGDVLDLVAPGSMGAAPPRHPGTPAGDPARSRLIDLRCAGGAVALFEVTSSTTDWNGEPAVRTMLAPVPDVTSRLRRLAVGVLSERTDSVIITDLRFHVRSWNEAAERLYGWTSRDALGRHILDLLPWDGDDGELAAAWEALEDTGQWNGIGTQTTRDGSAIEVFGTTTLVRDEGGQPVGIVTVNRAVPANPDPVRDHDHDHDDEQIRRGLARGEFEVHYQPVVAFDDHRVVGVEALARWRHPGRGLLAASEFIGVARRSELIIELGTFVLEQACGQAARWRQGGADLEVSVNLSARQLADTGLVDRVGAALAAAGLTPGALWLEVTETALVEEINLATEVLQGLVGLGVRIAIDDFGTGWASLVYLRGFPVSALKIDRSFVAGIGHNPFDTAIARSILTLGAELDLHVVAEGIETMAQQQALQQLGCRTGQGFLYGRPGPAADVPIHRASRLAPATGPSPGPAVAGPPAPSLAVAGAADDGDLVCGLLRSLLGAHSGPGAADLLQQVVRRIGGRLVAAPEAGEDALAVDVSLGQGPPLLVEAEPSSGARRQLERLLPTLVADARRMVDRLDRERDRGPTDRTA
jgi:PAS domain S-box-containing protein